jgi:hypothetical protein
MSHVAQIASPSTEAADRPGFDRLWHPRAKLCAVCTSRTRGFGWFDPHQPRGKRTYHWFCSMQCQAAFTQKARKGLTMAEITEEEHMAILGSLKPVARQLETYGWDTRLSELTEVQVLWLIETAVQEFREAMAEIASQSEVPF